MANLKRPERLSLKDLPASERPQERLERLGPKPLTDRELLAMLLRSGTAAHDVLSLADNIIKQAGSLAGLVRWDTTDFQKIPGIGKIKALQLSVHMEIAQRITPSHFMKLIPFLNLLIFPYFIKRLKIRFLVAALLFVELK